jgi:pSer/pThr/pTyr-binding forkhead associated (FHA) protein
MELKLVVLAGAKEGLEIPLKKEKFLIGRAKECALRAGSEAISRRHCAIIRLKDGRWAVRDLGSRNGTYINDHRITEPKRLKPGDELRVGPLKFRVAPAAKVPAAPDSDSAPSEKKKSRKQPPVKDVVDVVERTIKNKQSDDDSATEEDISRWLLDLPDPNGEATLKETRTIRLEETATHKHASTPEATTSATVEDTSEVSEPSGDEASDDPTDQQETPSEGEEKSGGWKLFRRGKGAGKHKPGKLPPRPEQATKDSREAAADILREMQRRR